MSSHHSLYCKLRVKYCEGPKFLCPRRQHPLSPQWPSLSPCLLTLHKFGCHWFDVLVLESGHPKTSLLSPMSQSILAESALGWIWRRIFYYCELWVCEGYYRSLRLAKVFHHRRSQLRATNPPQQASYHLESNQYTDISLTYLTRLSHKSC